MITIIDKYQDLPLVWGKTDCCQFVGECIEATFGHNPAKHVKYESEEAARQLFKIHGGLEGVITMLLGEPVEEYQDGYVGVVDNGTCVVAGVFFKDRIICRVETSLVDLPASRAKRIWKPCQVY